VEQPTLEEKKEFEQARYFVFRKSMFFLVSFLLFFIFMASFGVFETFKVKAFEIFSNTDSFMYIFIGFLIIFLSAIVNSIMLMFNKEYRSNYVKMGAYRAKYSKGQISFIRKIQDPKQRFVASFLIFFLIFALIDTLSSFFSPRFSFTLPDNIMSYLSLLVVVVLIGMIVWVAKIGLTKPKE